MMKIRITVAKVQPNASLPRYSHSGPFGDLAADLSAAEMVSLAAGETKAIGTGLAFEFPPEFGALVEDRSGLALKGITTLAGVIDPGYRGELKVVMANLGSKPFSIQPGDRIAQLRIVRRIEAEFIEAESVSETQRNTRGFGSTGN
ncbi:MAG TPA: dUTP diphosphatase [Terriglobia bacterium]|nr:dUTP diphosphatase [Terriglobia bacterium]